ncbi:MAG: hypothetical protein IT449_03215 [Phycisphaerales bacterium]|nr:hypothetical protein [Phycisphaerales bacterium]
MMNSITVSTVDESHAQVRRMRRLPLGLIAASLIPFALPFIRPVCDAFASWPGSMATVVVGTGLLLFAGFLCLASPLILLGLSVRRTREGSTTGVLVVAIYLAGYIASGRAQDGVRHRWFELWTRQPHPVIDAIHAYEEEHGEPPESLRDLSPKYIDDSPVGGPGNEPEYFYFVVPPEKSRNGERWFVLFWFPRNFIDRDTLYYYPQLRHPSEPREHLMARFGNWDWVFDPD